MAISAASCKQENRFVDSILVNCLVISSTIIVNVKNNLIQLLWVFIKVANLQS